MAFVQAFTPVDFTARSNFYGSVKLANGSTIVISDGHFSSTYTGEFYYDNSGNVHGSLKGLEAKVQGATAIVAFGFTIDANAAQYLMVVGDTNTLIKWVLSTADTIYGSSGNDVLVGFSGTDYISGGNGDDIIVPDIGNDIVEGGAGTDVALYHGVRKAYSISFGESSIAVESASEGLDTLAGIEVLEFLDGRLVFGVADPAAQVYRLYQAALARTPDPTGMNHWISALNGGTDIRSVAEGFVASGEFEGKYGQLSNQDFVEQLYQNVLHRSGDAGGIKFWTEHLDTGLMKRNEVLVGFSESNEHIEMTRADVESGLWDQNETAAAVARLYDAALDRLPDAGGLGYWTAAIQDGSLSLTQVADSFILSSEFLGNYGGLGIGDFVEQLYINCLDRSADPDGLAYWAQMLESGQMDRGDVLLGFSESREHQEMMQHFMNEGITCA